MPELRVLQLRKIVPKVGVMGTMSLCLVLRQHLEIEILIIDQTICCLLKEKACGKLI